MARALPEEITVQIEMTDEVRAIFDQAKREIDAMRPIVKAAVSLFDCRCEFEDYGLAESACGEHAEALDDAVIAYKRLLSEANS